METGYAYILTTRFSSCLWSIVSSLLHCLLSGPQAEGAASVSNIAGHHDWWMTDRKHVLLLWFCPAGTPTASVHTSLAKAIPTEMPEFNREMGEPNKTWVVFSDTKHISFFHTNPAILQHQLLVQPFHSILRVSRDPTDEGLVLQDCPDFRHQLKMGYPSCPHLRPANCQFKSSYHPLLGFDNLLEWLTKLSEILNLQLLVYVNGYNSGTAKCMGQNTGRGHLWALSGHATLPALQYAHQLASSANPFI